MRRVSQRLVLVLLLCPAAAMAAEYFGAIAYSQTKRSHGWANDYPSRRGAEKSALANCAKFSDDCTVVVWFRNACGALALGPNGAGWSWAEKQPQADLSATQACSRHSKACIVELRFCTTNVGSAPAPGAAPTPAGGKLRKKATGKKTEPK